MFDSTEATAVPADTGTTESHAASMDDTLNAAFDEIEHRETSTTDRARDPQGLFAKSETDPPVDDGATAGNETEAKNVPDDTVDPAAEAAKPEPKQPPPSWKANVREQFANLPAEVQDEVLRRQADFHKGIDQYRQDADYGRGLKAVLSPYAQDFASLGVNEAQAVGNLLQTERILRMGSPEQKLAVISSIVQSYGVPLEALISDDGNVRDAAMQNSALMTRINRLEQQLHGFTSQQQQQESSRVQSDIQAFASDPANKWFNDVREDMGRLLNSGMATDLKDAYDKACNMRSDIRAAILTQQQREADEKRQKEAQQRAAQAKKAAAVNVKPGGTTPTINNRPRTLDETLAEAYERLQAS